MCWEYLIGGMLLGILVGIAAKEAILILMHGWAYGEKLKIYDEKR